jgi:hypothetical protein
MKTRKITIEDLARMVQKGFSETAKKIELEGLREEMKKGFKVVDERFDKIEKLILADHKRRLEKLEEEMRDLKNLLAVK